jgi:hypothetical protein
LYRKWGEQLGESEGAIQLEALKANAQANKHLRRAFRLTAQQAALVAALAFGDGRDKWLTQNP